MCTSRVQPTENNREESRKTILRPASLLRRAGAMIYDALLLFGLLFVASVPLVGIDVEVRERFPVETVIQTYLLLVCFAYYAISWRRGGRTLGMRAWKLRLGDAEGRAPGWGRLIIRLFAALLSAVPFGAGYLWILFNARREAFHDRVSATYIYHET